MSKERANYVVTVDYFTKWAEVEPFVINFVTKNIICRFGVSQKIITNNRTQFKNT